MISTEELDKTARIARLLLDSSEKEYLLRDIKKILEAFSEIENLKESKEELFYATESKNPLRDDNLPSSFPYKKILEIAPKREGKYFKVPKLLE